MHICIHTYILHTHVHIHAHVHVHTHAHTHVHTHTRTHTHVHTRTHTHLITGMAIGRATSMHTRALVLRRKLRKVRRRHRNNGGLHTRTRRHERMRIRRMSRIIIIIPLQRVGSHCDGGRCHRNRSEMGGGAACQHVESGGEWKSRGRCDCDGGDVHNSIIIIPGG